MGSIGLSTASAIGLLLVGCGGNAKNNGANANDAQGGNAAQGGGASGGGRAGIGGAEGIGHSGAGSGTTAGSSGSIDTGGSGAPGESGDGGSGVGGTTSIGGQGAVSGQGTGGVLAAGGHAAAGAADALYDPSHLAQCPSVASSCRTCITQKCVSGSEECSFSLACEDYLTEYLECANDGHKLPGDLILCLASECSTPCFDKLNNGGV